MTESSGSITDLAEKAGLRELATGRKAPKVRGHKAKRGLLSHGRQEERRTIITQDYARDEFGEVGPRKRGAGTLCRQNGHVMRGWHRRPNDPAGRWNCYCDKCNRIAVACTEPVPGFEMVYGTAITEKCR